MATRSCSGLWSELPVDILRSVFECLMFMDFHRAKIVCSNWYSCSKQTLPKARPPLLMLFPEDDCVMCNPQEDKVYKTKRDFSGFRFLASSGKWFLVVDPELNVSIINLFSDKKIDLPPLESLDAQGATQSLFRTEDKKLMERGIDPAFTAASPRTAKELRGVLWVDTDKEELEYVVVWRFDVSHYIGFCKSGYVQHLGTPTDLAYDKITIPWQLQGLDDMLLHRDTLYIYTIRHCIRILSFSGQDGFKDVTVNTLPMLSPAVVRPNGYKLNFTINKIAVTTLGEVVLVNMLGYVDAATSTSHITFRLCKRDPALDRKHNCNLVEVDSLGDNALFLDSGLIVPADKTLGIEPNSIYFTRDDRVRTNYRGYAILNICVYNIATKTLKPISGLSKFKIKDALWFLPS